MTPEVTRLSPRGARYRQAVRRVEAYAYGEWYAEVSRWIVTGEPSRRRLVPAAECVVGGLQGTPPRAFCVLRSPNWPSVCYGRPTKARGQARGQVCLLRTC